MYILYIHTGGTGDDDDGYNSKCVFYVLFVSV